MVQTLPQGRRRSEEARAADMKRVEAIVNQAAKLSKTTVKVILDNKRRDHLKLRTAIWLVCNDKGINPNVIANYFGLWRTNVVSGIENALGRYEQGVFCEFVDQLGEAV